MRWCPVSPGDLPSPAVVSTLARTCPLCCRPVASRLELGSEAWPLRVVECRTWTQLRNRGQLIQPFLFFF